MIGQASDKMIQMIAVIMIILAAFTVVLIIQNKTVDAVVQEGFLIPFLGRPRMSSRIFLHPMKKGQNFNLLYIVISFVIVITFLIIFVRGPILKLASGILGMVGNLV